MSDIDSSLSCKIYGIGFDINHVIAREFAIGIEDLNSLFLEGCVLVWNIIQCLLSNYIIPFLFAGC
jgi:hypothetical protein